MNKSLIKFLTDFGPLIIFLFVYYRSEKDIQTAIPPLVIATVVSVAIVYFLERKIPYVPLIGASLVVLFGGLTIYFANPVFLYIKPTIINIIFAIFLLVGKILFKKNLLKTFFAKSLELQDIGWNKLMYRWISFFIFLAIVNEVVWRTQTEEFWVNFKVWGILSITFIFTFFQVPLINKYKIKND